MRAPVALAAVVLAAASLTACGGGSDAGSSAGASSSASSTETYCKDLKKNTDVFENFGSGQEDQVQTAFEQFHQFAEEAPSAVSSDWKLIDGIFTKLEQALKASGISLGQFANAQKTGKFPAGADVSQLKSVVGQIQTQEADFEKAAADIQKHAKSECKVDLANS